MDNGKIGPGFVKKSTHESYYSPQRQPSTVPIWAKIVIPCAVAAVVVLVVLSANGVFGESGTEKDDGSVKTPGVVNKHYEEAIKIADGADMLLVITGKENSKAIKLDRILRQDPKANKRVPKGSALLSVVSGGSPATPAPEEMPDVMFVPEKDAVVALVNAGIKYRINYVENDNVLDGLVAKQTELPSVEIDISTGSEAQDDALEAGGYVEFMKQIAENRFEREKQQPFVSEEVPDLSEEESVFDQDLCYSIEYDVPIYKTFFWDPYFHTESGHKGSTIRVTANIPNDWDFNYSVANYPSEPYEMKFDFTFAINIADEDEILNNYSMENDDAEGYGIVHILEKGVYEANGYKIIFFNGKHENGFLRRAFFIYDGTNAVFIPFYFFKDSLSSEDEQTIKRIIESIRF